MTRLKSGNRSGGSRYRRRRAISEIITVLLLVAIVVSMGVIVLAFASAGLGGPGGSFGGLIGSQGNAVAENFAVEQASFTYPGNYGPAIDGNSTNRLGGGSSSIGATLTTARANDVVAAYVSPADVGSATPPSVSGLSGGGLTWNHRVTTSATTFTQYYVPITLTNNVFSALSTDGSATGTFSTTNSGTITLSTTNPDDLIVVEETNEDGPNAVMLTVSSVTASGLTFAQRSSVTLGAPTYQDTEVWWAVATSALASTVIRVTLAGTTDDASLVAFGVSGANTTSPWDANAALPAAATGNPSTTPTVSGVSTSNPNDMILGFQGNGNNAGVVAVSETAGSGFTLIRDVTNNGAANADDASAEYETVSTAQSGISVGFGTAMGTNNYWMIIADAIRAEGAPTPVPFQQSVAWNPSTYSTYEVSDLGNVRFCADSGCVAPLYAWLESCTASCTPSATSATAWVRLTSAIPGGGGTLTIYMVFLGTSVDFDGNYWGEAPTLSATYGQFDNGANVFSAYFNGNTAISSFSVYSGYTLQQATGITGPGGATINTIRATGYNGSNPAFSFSTAMTNIALIVESSFSSPGSVTPGTDTGGAGLVDNAAASGVNNAISASMGYGSAYFDQDYEIGGAVTTDVNPQGAATASWLYTTVTYTGPSASSWSAFIAPQLYSPAGGYSGTVANNPLSGASDLYLGQISATTAAYTINLYYNFDRARAYPPSGVMPSTSLGSTSSVASTFDLEEWYAVAPSALSSASITATLSAPDTAATWIAVFGVSGANTASPFDPNPSLPATSAGASPSITMSTSNSNDLLLYGCAAGAGGMAAGFTSVYSNAYPPDQGEYVGYEGVSANLTNLATSCGTSSYGAEITDAVAAYTTSNGADLYVRNVGTISSTLVSVYIVDQSTNSFVSQVPISISVNAGALVKIPYTTLTFTPLHGHTYSFTVTSSLGNSVTYHARAA